MEIARNICIDEKIRSGRPVIKGTRVPVDLILGQLAGGMTYEEIEIEYEIKRQDILSVLEYGGEIAGPIMSEP